MVSGSSSSAGIGPSGRPLLEKWRIPREGLVIGRELIEARLEASHDDRVRRQHTRLRSDGNAIEISDLDSRNGSYVNGERMLLRGFARVFSRSVVRTGRTVWVVTPDVRRYEQASVTRDGPVMVGGTVRAALAAVETVARDEHDVMLFGPRDVCHVLTQRYVATRGGASIRIDLAGLAALDRAAPPRTVVLDVRAAPTARELKTLGTWLSTGARFVTLAPERRWARELPPRLAAREIAIPTRFDELPATLADIVAELAPGIAMHASVIDLALVRADDFDEDMLLTQFAESVKELRAKRATKLRAEDLEFVDLNRTLYGEVAYKRAGRWRVREPALITSSHDGPASGSWAGRRLCPDDACIGVIGGDGKCRVCGKLAPLSGSPYR